MPLKNNFNRIWLVIAVCATMTTFLFLTQVANAEEESIDVGIYNIYTTPTVDEENELREITVKIRNFGKENISQDITDTNPLNISCIVLNKTSLKPETLNDDEVQQTNEILSKDIAYLIWEWRPKFKGDYIINISIDFAIDENPINDNKLIITFVEFVYLSEDFEDDIDWETGIENSDSSFFNNAIDEWEIGTPVEVMVNGGIGPFGANSGNKCFGTDLDDIYGELNDEIWEGYENDSSILLTEVDLTTSRDTRLSFFHWLEIEDSGSDVEISDKAFVEISTDEGETWDEIWENPSVQDPENETIYRTNGWEQVILNQEKYDGKSSVLIRWRLQTNHNLSYVGWYIDDVGVFGREPLENDAGIESIDSPKNGDIVPLGRSTKVTATIINFGKNELINCKVTIKIDKTLGGGEPWVEEKYVGTVQNPIPTRETTQVSFDWPVSDLFNDVEYDITVSTHLTDASDKYIDECSPNDAKSIRVTVKNVFDVAVESINIYPRISERGKTRTVTATIVNYGNQEQRFNITLEAKWRQRDKDGNSPNWDDVEPMEPNPFHGMIHLEPWEKLTNWNTTFIPEIYAEYLLTLKASTELISYNFKIGLWMPNPPDEPDEKPENNEKSTTLMIPKVIWQDDMEWGPDESNGIWTHEPTNITGYDDWQIEEEGYHNSMYSWRCGQGKPDDPLFERLYHNDMNADLQSPVINLVEKKVERELGISFWMKYSIEPMDSRGKYHDSLYLEYLPINGDPSPQSSDWEAIYLKDYNHTPYHSKYWDARLFWPKDKGAGTSDILDYPGNEDGWVYNQIIFDEKNPETEEFIYVNKNGEPITDYLWDGFQFRFRFETDSKTNYTGPLIDDISVFGFIDTREPPVVKFDANWEDIAGNNHVAYSTNIIQSLPFLTEIDNVVPRYDGIPYDDFDYNIVTFDARRSACPWGGIKGLTYIWDFDENMDSDKDGNYTNDDDALIEEYVDNDPAQIKHRFTSFGVFTITLTVTDENNLENTDTIIVRCGDKPIYDVEIKIYDIFETEDSVSAVDIITKYGSGEEWTVWQGDKVVLSGAGAKDPEGRTENEFAFRWLFIEGNGDDMDLDDYLQWRCYKGGRGEPTIEYTFDKSGDYHIILEIDDAYNQERYESGIKPINLSAGEIANFSWFDDINITVLPFAKIKKTVFVPDMDYNVVEVRYEIAYQAPTLTTDDKEGFVYVNKTDEPEDAETNRHINIFINFQTKNMYDKEGKSGFVWAHIIVIYPKENLPEYVQHIEAQTYNPKDPKKPWSHVVLMYYWSKTFNTWVKCDNTMKAIDYDVRNLTAVECNVSHFTTLAPLLNIGPPPSPDPSIDSNGIEFSHDVLLGDRKEREMKIYAIIRNNGLWPIEEVDVLFKDGDEVIEKIVVENISGRGSKLINITWKLKKDINIGTHTIKVELDPNNLIEGNYDDNDIAMKKIEVIELVSSSIPRYSKRDTDKDGIINIFDEDDDNDGFTDLEEKKAKTDILDSESYPDAEKKDLWILLLIITVCISLIYILQKNNKKVKTSLDLDLLKRDFTYQISRKFIVLLIIIIFTALIFSGHLLTKGRFDYSVHDKPKGSMYCVGSNVEVFTVKVIEMNPTFGVKGLPWVIKDSDNNIIEQNYGPLDDIYGLKEGNVTFHDNDRDGKISPEDTFSISKIFSDGTKIQKGYKLILMWDNEVLCEAVLKE